jgi:outer membrane protein assembly factor BamD (BamD/ComL family)
MNLLNKAGMVSVSRISRMVAVAGIFAVALTVLPHAGAAAKPKKKKNTDLSANPLANVASRQPDKELFDKAMIAMKKGRFDVARLDLQTLLNTYPESEFKMRAKLAVGDSWFKEGGSAALTQAEAEYNDFITFFPNAPEAAEAQMKSSAKSRKFSPSASFSSDSTTSPAKIPLAQSPACKPWPIPIRSTARATCSG